MTMINLTNTLALMQELRSELKAEFSKQLEPALKRILELTPGAASVGWDQYTPYFNDGDPCEFSVNGVYCFDQEDDEIWQLPEEVREIGREIMAVPTTVFLDCFGEHASIRFDGKNLTVSECHHD